MQDLLGRSIEYLRISVTEKCNLHCIYCKPQGLKPTHCKEVFTPKDYGYIVKAMANNGIKKVRLTGGEPLLRQDIADIVYEVSSILGICEVSLTTNGVFLKDVANDLKKAGLSRVNISIDSLKENTFKEITGGKITDVMAGIEAALSVGLTPLKLNTVLIKGKNDAEVDDFIDCAKKFPMDVRFIELMPIGSFGENNKDKIIHNSQLLSDRPWLKPIDRDILSSDPATLYTADGFKGKVGFISPMGHKFCHLCNRIRLTCDGKLKLCLGDNGEVDLLHQYIDKPETLEDFINMSILKKPKGHNFKDDFTSNRSMNKIGG